MTTLTISLPDKIAKEVDIETRRQGYATRSEFIRGLIRKYFSKAEAITFEEFKPIPLGRLKLELARSGKYSEKFINSVVSGLSKSSVYAS